MLDLPFFDDRHRQLASRLRAFAAESIEPRAAPADSGDPDAAGREFIGLFAREGLLRLLVAREFGGTDPRPDLRSICLAREALAASSGLADSVFAVQGLGSYPIGLAADEPLRRKYLARASNGEAIGAFALTEPDAGSDAAALDSRARRDGADYVLDGAKTLISNAGIADFFVVFAKTDEAAGRKGISAFLVDAGTPGLRVTSISMMAPHPIGDLVLDGCRVPAANRLGAEGEGLRLAFATLDFYRASVAAAACGLAERALREATARASMRRQFGNPISEFQGIRFALAEMATELDAGRLLVYRAAWKKDHGAERVTHEASTAKLFATEAAQRIVDRAVQVHGGIGVRRGTVVERLYREVRALRIYEGTSEIQRLIIADRLLKGGGVRS